MLGELRPVDGGMPILLDKPSLTVGHDRTCDVVIEHPSVSANHCHMEFRDGYWFIEDLGSGGGISVNGEKVERAWVPALSVINIGGIEFDLQYSSQTSDHKSNGTMSPEMMSKLDRALRSAQSYKARRVQIRADQPASTDLPRSSFGMLKPVDGAHSIPLLYDELYLGRDADCDVILPYLSVASAHCVLRFQEGYWSVRDLNNNGVTINGTATQEGWLLPGDVLGIATRQFEMAYTTTATTLPPEMAVPINEFDVSDDEAMPDSDFDDDVIDLDESALIDSDDEFEVVIPTPEKLDQPLDTSQAKLALGNVAIRAPEPPAVSRRLPPVLDEPLLAIDEMLQSIEDASASAVSQVAPPAKPKVIEPDSVKPPTEKLKADVAPKPKTKAPAKPKKASPKVDRKSQTVQEPPAPATAVASQPAPSVIAPPADFGKLRRDQIVKFLADRQFDGLLLTQPTNIAWYTGGTDPPRNLFGQATAALLLTPDSANLLAGHSDAEMILNSDSSLANLQHRTCEWPEGSSQFLKNWGEQKRLASDCPTGFGTSVPAEIASMRLPLSAYEIEVLRKLAIRVTRAIEKAAREFPRGDTEAQIAGDVTARLVRHEVVPERIQVWGDGRGQACPNWKFRRDPVEHFCTISVMARRQGLHIAVSRTVSFGTPPKELRWTHSDMLLTHATAMHAARDQAEAAAVVTQVENACEKLGFVPDWTAGEPGCVTGYDPREAPISSRSSLTLQSGMPLIWQSSLGPARAVDTLLVRKANSKWLTQTGEWPQLRMSLDDAHYFGQAVLQRPA